MTTAELLKAAYELAKPVEWCFINTASQSGINSRIVQPLALDEDFTFRFMTSTGSRKAKELQANPQMTVAFLNNEERSYVSFGGTAVISTDLSLKQSIWQEPLRMWFPDGPEGLDVATVSCQPDWIEMWSIAREIAPPPLGLSSMRLTRQGNDWVAAATWPDA
jgi:general stress protein 26